MINESWCESMKTFKRIIISLLSLFAGLFVVLAKKQMPKKSDKLKEKKKKQKKVKKKNNLDSGTMDMIGSFTVLRFTSLLAMRNVFFTKEELLKMNRKLNRIKKPKV